jgi:hypothetical protein
MIRLVLWVELPGSSTAQSFVPLGQEELLRELRRPSPETLMLQRDLERARENLRQEQVVYEQQKQLLESRLKEEVSS